MDANQRADGGQLAVGAANDSIYLGTRTLPPTLKIQPSPVGDMVLSWLVPSTSFALQENADIMTGNWMTLSSVPALNFNTLEYEVTVPPTDAAAFFRLKSGL